MMMTMIMMVAMMRILEWMIKSSLHCYFHCAFGFYIIVSKLSFVNSF